MPSYVPSNLIKPQYASVDGSSPGFLTYPTTLVHTVHDVPGDGGSFTGITPLWASIPSPSGNTYYAAVNKALGATLTRPPAAARDLAARPDRRPPGPDHPEVAARPWTRTASVKHRVTPDHSNVSARWWGAG
jgi:putative aldouronate transport system substrate-binding protein